MSAAEFDWLEDRDSIVVPEQRAVAAFWNVSGDLVLRQERDQYRDEDDVIIIARSNVEAVAFAIWAKAREIAAENNSAPATLPSPPALRPRSRTSSSTARSLFDEPVAEAAE